MESLNWFLHLLYIVVIAVAVGFALEWIIPQAEPQPLKNKLTNVLYLPVYVLSLAVFAALVARGLAKILPPIGPLFSIDWGTKSHLGAVAQILLFSVAYDFFYYWWHRAQHQIPALWAIHQLHHSDTSINVSSAARHHWLEETLRPLVVIAPLGFIFSFTPITYPIVGFVFIAWPYYIHMNARLHLGVFGKVLVGPQFHRVHHSVLMAHRDKNFAAFFPLWDYLFGTAHTPARDEFPRTGVDGDPGQLPDIAKATVFSPFRDWWNMIRPNR